MNDYILLHMIRQREAEILKEVEAIRLVKARKVRDRNTRKNIWTRLKANMVSWKRGMFRSTSQTRGIDSRHRTDQAMHHDPEL